MAALILTVLAASVLGSLHCAAMCGPLAAVAVLPATAGEARSSGTSIARGRAHLLLAYNSGRLVGYVLLGVLAGLLGAALDVGGALVGLQRAAMLSAGVVMVVLGTTAALRIVTPQLFSFSASSVTTRWIRAGHVAAMTLPVFLRALTIGSLTALLPCGWLHAFVVAAAGTGSPLHGALILAAFWLGTLPVLVALGIGVQTLTGVSDRRLQLAASVLVVTLGLVSLAGRWRLPPHAAATLDRPPATLAETARGARSVGPDRPPCPEHDR